MKDDLKVRIKAMSSFGEVKAAITEWLDYYNNRRYQWQLAKLAPNEFYQYQVTGVYPISGVTVPSARLNPEEC